MLAVGPIAMGILMIKGKYFEIERALEKKEFIREGEDMEDMLLS